MKLQHIKEMLIRHEGSNKDRNGNHIPYNCTAKKLTLGYGRNIEDRGISEQEALFLLENDIALVIGELKVNFHFFEYLSEQRQEALIDMCFNLGIFRFKGFKKMIAALAAGDYTKASKEMLDSMWARQVGRRARNLSEMIREG